MKLSLAMYFILFIFYSVAGWAMESLFCFYKTKKLVNRGFLIGPLCPIYGFGSIAFIFLLSKYENDLLVIFVMAAFICTILEYYTSYIMEKLFKARWWDYSDKLFHINGRVCAENTVAFGILAILVIKYINPFILRGLTPLSRITVNSIAIVLAVILLVDMIVSLKVINGFTKVASSVNKDSTEEITKRVREILTKRGGLYKRLVSAFNFKASSKLLLEITTRIKDEAVKQVGNASAAVVKVGGTVTKTVGTATKKVGTATKEVGKKVGSATKEVGKKVGTATKKVGTATKSVGTKITSTVSNKKKKKNSDVDGSK